MPATPRSARSDIVIRLCKEGNGTVERWREERRTLTGAPCHSGRATLAFLLILHTCPRAQLKFEQIYTAPKTFFCLSPSSSSHRGFCQSFNLYPASSCPLERRGVPQRLDKLAPPLVRTLLANTLRHSARADVHMLQLPFREAMCNAAAWQALGPTADGSCRCWSLLLDHSSPLAVLQAPLISQHSQDGSWGNGASRTARGQPCHSGAALHKQVGVCPPASSRQGRISKRWLAGKLGSRSRRNSSGKPRGCMRHPHHNCSAGSKWDSLLLSSSSSGVRSRRSRRTSSSRSRSLGSLLTWLWWRG